MTISAFARARGTGVAACASVSLAAFFSVVGCSPSPKAPVEPRAVAPTFSQSAPALGKGLKIVFAAEEGAFKDETERRNAAKEAFPLFEGAVSGAVRSGDVLFGASAAAAAAGDTDRAFAYLDSALASGLADAEGLDEVRLLSSLRTDPRWPGAVARARANDSRMHDPDAAKLDTTDIDHFWRAYDAAMRSLRQSADPKSREATEAAAKEFGTLYIDQASAVLQTYYLIKVGALEDLVDVTRGYPKFFDSIRPNTLRTRTLEPEFRALFRRMREVVPDAVFPDVTFVMGSMSSGGTSVSNGLVVGMDLNARGDDTVLSELSPGARQMVESTFAQLPHLVTHELAHAQQHGRAEDSLLAQSLKEGGADFVAFIVSGATANPALDAYGPPHEVALWQEFQADMKSTGPKERSRWLYGKRGDPNRPADLGYFVGFRICKAYYDRTADKRSAMHALLNIDDAYAFLAASGYDPK
jgi:hypothetical protein